MDCSVICHGQIRLTGRKGSIIGGKVQAIRGLIATSLGNDAEKRTEIFVGAGIDVYSRLRVMEKKIETTREELAKIEEITGQDRNKTVQCCCRIAEVSASKIA